MKLLSQMMGLLKGHDKKAASHALEDMAKDLKIPMPAIPTPSGSGTA